MSIFELLAPNRIIFGVGASAGLGMLASHHGRRILVVTGRHPERYEAVSAPAEDAGIVAARIAVDGEPTVEAVRRGAQVARQAGCDAVVSIGGGSVIDTGKAISALLTNPGDVLDYLEVIGNGRQLADAPVPHVAVPTTAGTGSEATKNAVVLSSEHGLKVSMRSPLMVPTIALVDPGLTSSMPRSVTVGSGLDAMTHLLESYVSRRANPLVDPMVEDGIRRAARSLFRAAAEGDDMEARIDMSLAGLYGGIALANAGLGVVHGLAGVLGGRLGIPHGLACGCLLAPAFDVNTAVAESAGTAVVERFVRVARLLTGSSEATARDSVEWLVDLAASLDLPALGEYGLSPDLYAEVCADAARSSSMQGNPVPLDPSQLEDILRNAGRRSVR